MTVILQDIPIFKPLHQVNITMSPEGDPVTITIDYNPVDEFTTFTWPAIPAPVGIDVPAETYVDFSAPITFTATASGLLDEDAIDSYHWYFGDGTEDEGVEVTHTYTSRIPFRKVVVAAKDTHGRIAYSSRVLIPGPLPVATPEVLSATTTTVATIDTSVIPGESLVQQMPIMYFNSDTPGVLRFLSEDGSETDSLDTTKTNATGAMWHPDGTKILFADFESIYVINRDGTGLTELVAGGPLETDIGYWNCCWSDDGTKILATEVGPTVTEGTLVTFNADGTGRSELSKRMGVWYAAGYNQHAWLAPSIYVSSLSYPASLVTEPVGGAGQQYYVGKMADSGTDQVWSILYGDNLDPSERNWYSYGVTPTGQVMWSREDATNSTLGVVNTDGTGDTVLFSTAPGDYIGFAIFSPDETRVAYWIGDNRLHVADADGSNDQYLTPVPAAGYDNLCDWYRY